MQAIGRGSAIEIPNGLHVFHRISFLLPSGKRLHNYGKSACSMGKSTISMGHGFNSKLLAVSHYQRVNPIKFH